MNRTYYSLPFTVRVCVLALLLGGEALLASVLLDGTTPVPGGAWLSALIHSSQTWVAKFGVSFSVLFATFAFLRYKAELTPLSSTRAPIGWRAFGGHLAAIGLFSLASIGVFHRPGWTAQDSNLAAIAWIVAAAAVIAGAGLALLEWNEWREIRRITGWLGLYAAGAAVVTCAAITLFRSLWGPASRVTFHMVQFFLRPLVSGVEFDPDRLIIGTEHFAVMIQEQCSGLEGIALLLVFGGMWLVLFRNESRFPQALILLPLGVAALFLLNALRITALILIGNAGATEVAHEGFHSQAGWIAFNSIAFGSAIVARRWKWVAIQAPSPAESPVTAETAHPTGAFLVPFLAILAAGMLSRAVSGAFEWLYSIRVAAVLIALWFFRRSYSRLDWKPGILAPATGVAVFLIWIAADRLAGHNVAMPAALADASAPVRYWWIGLRIFGAVATVPVAEELAFRGFALRRFMSADFESIPFRSVSWLAVLGSSVLFGVMHGERWILATVAGVMYALLIRRTGRIGDAVYAHALTNGLLALCVLIFGQWQLW